MAIHWRLKTYLTSRHGIYSATAFQKHISKKTGILISVANLCNYLKQKPKRITLETIELLCSTLNCKLSDFCEIEPKIYKVSHTKKLAPQNTPLCKKNKKAFPDPGDYKL